MARGKRGNIVNGWVILDKPVGITSTEAVGLARRLFNARKVGHSGTLDPLASGILPLAFGEATKLVSHVMEGAKAYEFTVCWGEERETDDAEGAVTAHSDARPDPAAIEAALPGFIGNIEQTPPIYSAIKVDGARAYDLARDGNPAKLQPRPVRIDSLKVSREIDANHTAFHMICGKGAYVRAVARDLGRVLGCYGYVAELRRSAVGGFREEDAISLDNLRELGHKGALADALHPVETALADIPALAVTGNEAHRLKCGQSLRVPSSKQGMVYVTSDKRLIALAEITDGEVRPVRVFNH